MDWNSYKRLCDSPPVFSRWMLEQTILLAQSRNVHCEPLQQALAGSVIEKPDGHTGGSVTDMFTLDLELGYAAQIVALITQASAAGDATPATRNRGLGGFLEAWREYAEFLEQQLN